MAFCKALDLLYIQLGVYSASLGHFLQIDSAKKRAESQWQVQIRLCNQADFIEEVKIGP